MLRFPEQLSCSVRRSLAVKLSLCGLVSFALVGCGGSPPPAPPQSQAAVAPGGAQVAGGMPSMPGMGGAHAPGAAGAMPGMSGSNPAGSMPQMPANPGAGHGGTAATPGAMNPGAMNPAGAAAMAANSAHAGATGQIPGSTAPVGSSADPTAAGAHAGATTGNPAFPSSAPGGAPPGIGSGLSPQNPAQPGAGPMPPAGAHAAALGANPGLAGNAGAAGIPGAAGQPGAGAIPGAGGGGLPGSGASGGGQQFTAGSVEEVLLKFCTAMAEGNLTAAGEHVSSKAKGELGKIREADVSEARLEELRTAFTLKDLQTRPSRSSGGSGKAINLGNAKGQVLAFVLSKEDEVFKVKEFTLSKPKK